MKDGFNLKGLATTVFLFFACLAPAVAFGGLMGKVTDGHVRTIRTDEVGTGERFDLAPVPRQPAIH